MMRLLTFGRFKCEYLIMGIEGLLRNLKEIVQVRHLREYNGLTVAIDTYCWYKLWRRIGFTRLSRECATTKLLKGNLAIDSFGNASIEYSASRGSESK